MRWTCGSIKPGITQQPVAAGTPPQVVVLPNDDSVEGTRRGPCRVLQQPIGSIPGETDDGGKAPPDPSGAHSAHCLECRGIVPVVQEHIATTHGVQIPAT